MSVFITAEIGINHNGDLQLAKRLIDAAVVAGCDAVKFQKRTVDKVYTQEYLDSPRKSPWGETHVHRKRGWNSARKNMMRSTDIVRRRELNGSLLHGMWIRRFS